jgi:hypothetical protein
MSVATIACARCAMGNHPSNRFCSHCGLPLGAVQADAGAVLDVLEPYEALDPAEGGADQAVRELVARSGLEAAPFGHGWRLLVPLHLDRQQAVYVGLSGSDSDGRPVVSVISVCGPANERDARTLLKLNTRAFDGHFAIKVLRGEEYFVVVHSLVADTAATIDAASLVRRIAREADGLEDRLSRGRDIY